MSEHPIQVLLVDDDADLRDLLRQFFQQRGIAFSVLHDATHLNDRLARERPSIVVLDRLMPGVDGLTALRQLRAQGDPIPVIMLTAHAEGVDRVLGLEMGADDYLGKPFLPQELLARIHAVLRRHAQMPLATTTKARPPCHFGRFRLDFATRTLFRDGKPLKMTDGEYTLLEIFASRPMETISRTRLLDLMQEPYIKLTERGIDLPVWRLRRLIEDDPSNPRRLQTRRGVGYMFIPDGPDDEQSL